MEFNPKNNIVKLCLQGMELEGKDRPQAASRLYLQAWNEASNDFERFIAAYQLATHERDVSEELNWLETALQLALKVNDDSVKAAFGFLYKRIGKCHEDLNDLENAKKNYELANSFTEQPSEKGPFYHGTKADLQVGDLLTAGYSS